MPKEKLFKRSFSLFFHEWTASEMLALSDAMDIDASSFVRFCVERTFQGLGSKPSAAKKVLQEMIRLDKKTRRVFSTDLKIRFNLRKASSESGRKPNSPELGHLLPLRTPPVPRGRR